MSESRPKSGDGQQIAQLRELDSAMAKRLDAFIDSLGNTEEKRNDQGKLIGIGVYTRAVETYINRDEKEKNLVKFIPKSQLHNSGLIANFISILQSTLPDKVSQEKLTKADQELADKRQLVSDLVFEKLKSLPLSQQNKLNNILVNTAQIDIVYQYNFNLTAYNAKVGRETKPEPGKAAVPVQTAPAQPEPLQPPAQKSSKKTTSTAGMMTTLNVDRRPYTSKKTVAVSSVKKPKADDPKESKKDRQKRQTAEFNRVLTRPPTKAKAEKSEPAPPTPLYTRPKPR